MPNDVITQDIREKASGDNSIHAQAPSNVSPVVGKPSEKIRLDYLDGIRGLCALYVVYCHADITFGGLDGIPAWVIKLLPTLWFAHYSVAFFIVLSGYCLMLPVARSRDGFLRGGTMDYIKRRARRILPPYYAALALSLLIAALPIFRQKVGIFGEVMFPAYNPKFILAHLLLVHNLHPEAAGRIDPPMWSVAPEWQIYFFLPLVLLPLWRRFGIGATILFAFFLGYLPHFFCFPSINFDWTAPWYLGLFALGMGAAVINFGTNAQLKKLESRTALLLAPLLFFPIVGYAVLERHDWQERHTWLMDALVGFAAAATIAYTTREILRGKRPLLARLLESRFVQWLGLISYSLYLIHFPILTALTRILVEFHPTAPMRFVWILLVFVPLCVVAAYVFHLVFERPFMPSHGRDVRATQKAN